MTLGIRHWCQRHLRWNIEQKCLVKCKNEKKEWEKKNEKKMWEWGKNVRMRKNYVKCM